MKIKLSKPHLNYKAGDEIEVTSEQANYFKRVGLSDGTTEQALVPEHKKAGRPKSK